MTPSSRDYLPQPAGLASGLHLVSDTDMARFMIARLEGGFYGDASTEIRILEEETARQMLTTLYTPDPRLKGTAYGLFDLTENGRWVLGHDGYSQSSIFERVLPVYLDDHDYAELQQYVIENPEAGEVVPGSGGVRKVRWARPGAGKRGGLRIIYFVRYRPNEIWMLTVYAKARRENVPAHILKQLVEAFRDG